MRHFINGVEVTPSNLGEIGFVSQFNNVIDDLDINVDSVLLKREDYEEIIKPHIQQVGFLEGLPYDIVSNSGVTVNYFINFKENPIFRTYEVELKIQKREGIGLFMDRAKGTSFELIRKTVNFPLFDVPYVIIKDDQAVIAISMAITLYIMVKEVIDATKQLVLDITDLIGSVTPNVGFGVNFDIGDIISKVLKVIAQLAYVALLLIALINLSKQLFELIFPKIRYFKACKYKDLLRIGCQYLGFNFSSTALDALPGLTVLPKPLQKQSKKWFDFAKSSLDTAFNKGYPTASDTIKTVWDALEEARKIINGRIRIIGNTVHLERRDYWSLVTNNSIVPALALQETRSDEWTPNTDESWKRMYIYYQSDISDLHTYDNFEGVDAEYSAEPTSVINADLVSITGLRDIQINFALGARKDSLNWLEKFVKDVFKSIDKAVNTFVGNSSLASKIENRIGVLMVSQQYFGTTKLLYTVAGKQPANYLSYIRASRLYDQFYNIDRIEVNGFKIRNDVSVAVNYQDFVALLNNNYAEINGAICEITEFDYIEDAHLMTISYREPYNYANGKVQTIQING
jgi:hypothetical protein